MSNFYLKPRKSQWPTRMIFVSTLLAAMLTSATASQLFAQVRTVSGTVNDASGQPLPGVSVVVKSTSTGAVTDSDGLYAVSVSSGDAVLVFSFIGFRTQEVVVGNKTSINVEMSEDAEQLREVVVTALGIERDTRSLAYATQSIKAKELVEVRDPNNLLNSFQGKIANAVVTQGSGGPGSGARIVLRGNRSIQGNNNALIVVDGIPINNNTFSVPSNDFGAVAGSDGAANINPDDIESLTVLRGASAAALYGSQAGNGVIVITTKKGKRSGLGVTINTGITAEQAFALPRFQNAYGQGSGGILNPTAGDSWGASLSGQSYTNYLGEQRSYSPQEDNVKDFFRTGVTLNNSIGISGGNEKMQTYLSYTNNRVQGIIEKNDLIRHTFNLRLSNQVTSKFSTDAKITYIVQDIENKPRTGEENAPVIDIYQIPRNVSIDDARRFEAISGEGVPTPTPWPSTVSSIYQNPYWMINRTSINESRNRLIGFLSARYQLTDWLNVTGRASIDRSFDNNTEQYSEGTILYTNAGGGGTYAKQYITNTQRWFDVMLQGSNKISSDLSVDYRIGTIFQDNLTESDRVSSNGLNVTNQFSLEFLTNPAFTSDFLQTRINSTFGQASLSYKDALFVEGTVRTDWDSRLPSPYSFTYYSAGVSAVLSELMQLPSAISFLKLSANYAQVGNGGGAQLRFNTYQYSPGAGNGFIFRSTRQAIPDLKPEIVSNTELGIESRFFSERLGLSIIYYNSNSENQLLVVPLPAPTGFQSRYINAGNIRNRGVELVLSATPIKVGDFQWDVTYNLGINRNKVIELDENLKQVELGGGFARSATPIVREGGSFGELIAFKWARNDQGQFLVNANGLPISTVTQESIGNFNPDATMGLTNSFSYGPFSLRVLIDGRVGGTIVSGTEMNLAFSGITEATEENREGGWNLGGVNASGQPVGATVTAQQFWQTASGKRNGTGEFFAYDATSFRVRELSLGYEIPVPSGWPIRSARLSFVARNVMWLYRGKSKLDIPGLARRTMWFDPDMSLGNGNFQGVEYGTLPATRSIGFNLGVTF